MFHFFLWFVVAFHNIFTEFLVGFSKRHTRHHQLVDFFYTIQIVVHATVKNIFINLDMRQHEVTYLQIEQGLEQARIQLDTDQTRLQVLSSGISGYEQALKEANILEADYAEQLQVAEQAMHDWQSQWETVNRSTAEQQRVADVEKARIEQLQRQQQQLQQRNERLSIEQSGFTDDGLIEDLEELRLREQEAAAELETQQAQLEESEARIFALRDQQAGRNQSLSDLQERIQAERGRLVSLKTLQEAALGDDGTALQNWLQTAGLQQTAKLAEELLVEPGWEQAVETVLAPFLEARLVEELSSPVTMLDTLQQGELTLITRASRKTYADSAGIGQNLASKVESAAAIDVLLAGVWTAENLDEAFVRHPQLQDGESLITRNGIWLGRHWLRVTRKTDEAGSGILQRERQIRELESSLARNSAGLEDQRQQLQRISADLSESEQQRKQQQDAVNHCHREHARVESQVDTLTHRLEQTQQRRQSITAELTDLQGQAQSQQEELLAAQQNLQEAVLELGQIGQERQILDPRQAELSDRLQECRNQYDDVRRTVQEKTIALESLKSEYNTLQSTQQRLQQQHEALQTRRQQLQETQPVANEPHTAERLDNLLRTRVQTEQAVSQARQELDTHNLKLQQLEQQRNQYQNKLQDQREVLEKSRLSCTEAGVRRQTVLDQLTELGFELSEVLGELPETAEEQEWQARQEAVAGRIQRLGAINLAAIEEFEQLSERKSYLDTQNDDLVEALTTLESAMARIDRETRSRFREMYDQVNQGLQNLFPRLFGGGQAYLDLTDDDALEAGVTIMARPPGKRNGTIHLLSGGEKALTAVAFIFSIFQLNPAPFCMLDEVDAPLDDANVGRFGALLKEMSDQVQFIVVTHNKVTMEAVDHLIGVTMHEPGVSRLVSVDVDEAIRLAAI
jgi:chromosome segregation protein